MHRVINHLVQLQELALVREQEAFMGGDRLKELDQAITSLTEQLPPDVRSIFQRLQKKDVVAVVPVSCGVCSTCGMRLPISLVQAVRAERRVEHCPNCTRILFYTESVARSFAKQHKRTAPRKIGMERFSAQELMVPRMSATAMEGAIRELALKMEAEGFVEKPDSLVEAALRREAIISTATSHGVAFPHVRGVEGGGLTLALGISPKGIPFSAEATKTLTHIVFFIVIPTAANAFYLRLVAGLAETFSDAEARSALLDQEDAALLWKVLRKLTRKTIP